jgi:hypothetical protein
MKPEIPAPLHLEPQTGNTPFDQRSNVRLRRLVLLLHLCGLDSLEERANLANQLQARGRSAVAKPSRAEGAVVRLHRRDMPSQLGCMGIAISQRTPEPVLLVGPEHYPDSATRLQLKSANQPDRFPGSDRAAAIVDRPLPDVPRVDVPTQQHDFLGPLPAADLGDHVAGRGVRKRPAPEDESQYQRVSPLLHPMEHLGVLHAHRRRGDLAGAGVVAHGPRMGTPDRERRDRSDQAGHRPGSSGG